MISWDQNNLLWFAELFLCCFLRVWEIKVVFQIVTFLCNMNRSIWVLLPELPETSFSCQDSQTSHWQSLMTLTLQMDSWCLCSGRCLPPVYVGACRSQKGWQMSWSWSSMQLWVATWVLEMACRSSGIAASALGCWALYPTQVFYLWMHTPTSKFIQNNKPKTWLLHKT